MHLLIKCCSKKKIIIINCDQIMCSCDQLRKLVPKERPVGRMSLEPWCVFIAEFKRFTLDLTVLFSAHVTVSSASKLICSSVLTPHDTLNCDPSRSCAVSFRFWHINIISNSSYHFIIIIIELSPSPMFSWNVYHNADQITIRIYDKIITI